MPHRVVSVHIQTNWCIDYCFAQPPLWWPMRATLNKFCFWHFFEKNNKRNKTQFYFRFKNTFISQMFSKWKHFRFKNKLFSFRKHSLLFAIENVYFSNTKIILLSFRKHFHLANVFWIKTFSIKKKFFSSRKHFHFCFRNTWQKNWKKSYRFCSCGPCVPPSVEGQCFHLRRFDLQILLCRCLAPVARDRIGRTCRLVWVFPCCDDLSLAKCLWGICNIRRATCGLE